MNLFAAKLKVEESFAKIPPLLFFAKKVFGKRNLAGSFEIREPKSIEIQP